MEVAMVMRATHKEWDWGNLLQRCGGEEGDVKVTQPWPWEAQSKLGGSVSSCGLADCAQLVMLWGTSWKKGACPTWGPRDARDTEMRFLGRMQAEVSPAIFIGIWSQLLKKQRRGSVVWWLWFVILALWRLRQRDCPAFNVCLGYTQKSKSTNHHHTNK